MGRKLNSSARSLLIALLGILGLGGGLTVSRSAQAADLDYSTASYQCDPTEEQCACEEALKKNTIHAIEEFLRKYPPGRSPSACSALALGALSQYDGCGEGAGSGKQCGGGGYGT
jgi:hypothetical protein